ncbi:MAG: capsular polysaccharide biosynthesis protein [Bacillota bacterium]
MIAKHILTFIKKIVKKFLFYGTVINYIFMPLKASEHSVVAFVFNVAKWKRPFVEPYLAEYKNIYIPNTRALGLLPLVFRRAEKKVFIIWGYKNDEAISQYAEEHNVPVYRMEDGFIRSVGLGSMHTPPFSLCLDKKGMYFDSTKPSDLEEILNTYDFQGDHLLLNRAKKCISHLQQLGISKYNHVGKRDVDDIYGPKTKKRILVIGQVEDDASILMGSDKNWTNNDLVRLASEENPEAEIIYKPHPDVLTGRRKKQSNPNDIRHIAKVIEEPLSLADSFKTIDHIYTITSLSGFEAIIRDIPVTTAGAPFYSGWGLTDDRQIVDRRKRTLTKEELFAGAYILYPKYIDPLSKEPITLEETIKRINRS